MIESLDNFNEAIKNVIESASNINAEVADLIRIKAPIIIHQRLCEELVSVARDNPQKTPIEIPEAIKILTAIDVLENFYPELKSVT